MQPELRRGIAIAGIIAGVYVGLKYILPPMIPFLIGWLLAVWIYPYVCRLERKLKIKRSVWAGLFMGVCAAAAVFLLYKGSCILLEQVKEWIKNYPVLESYGEKMINRCCCAVEEVTGISGRTTKEFLFRSMGNLRQKLWSGGGSRIFEQMAKCVKSLVWVGSGAVIAVISGILFVKDLSSIRKQLRTFRFYPRWRRVLIRLKETGAAYLKAQLVIMFIIALLSAAGLWMMKSPYYLLFGVALGILDALPIIGTGLFTYPAMILFFLQGKLKLAVGCLLIEVITTVVRELLEPRLIGDKVGVYPVVIMAAIYVGLLLFGILGFVLGPVALLLIYAIGKEWDVWD